MEAIETTKGRRATLREAFSQKYPKYVQILNVYEQANLCSADWENITKVNLSRFADELQNRVARNTAKYYCAMLKSVLSLYSDEVELPKDYAKVLSVKGGGICKHMVKRKGDREDCGVRAAQRHGTDCKKPIYPRLFDRGKIQRLFTFHRGEHNGRKDCLCVAENED